MGAPDLLWPRDCTSIEELPTELIHAVDHANRICDWQENLPKDEMPPEWMWPFEEELVAWFESVNEAREAERSSSSPNGDTSVPMMQNEMAEGRRG